jgi:hypothetical protein
MQEMSLGLSFHLNHTSHQLYAGTPGPTTFGNAKEFQSEVVELNLLAQQLQSLTAFLTFS